MRVTTRDSLPNFRGHPDSKVYFNIPSHDELKRVELHKPEPDLRWHYRYHAAALCWDAADLLPDNTEQTAFALWQGGWWLRNQDPQTADSFYKALVRRNPDIELAVEADRLRWFPKLDADGKLLAPSKARESDAQLEAESSVLPEPDIFTTGTGGERLYILHAGDTLRHVAALAEIMGLQITVQDILNANPGVSASRLKVGQRIIIPDRPH
jgi:hypothetical protein